MIYNPTKADTLFAEQIVDTLKDGGAWGIPATNMVYIINKKAKTLTLIYSQNNDDSDIVFLHSQTRETFRTIGYKVLSSISSVRDN